MPAIVALFIGNRGDRSLFRQSRSKIADGVERFRLVVDDDAVVGCAALVWWTDRIAEVSGVAVDKRRQGEGVGTILIAQLVEEAQAEGAELLWLSTTKPGYFSRFGFELMSRWRLPLWVLLRKFRTVFQQPPNRWRSAVFGGHVFMCRPRGASPQAR